MIWFTCTKCRKVISRPETSAGAFVFCDCGQGMVVPWESTMSAPAEPEADPQAPPVPRVVPLPMPMDEEPIPVAKAAPSSARSDGSDARSREWAKPSARDPNACFNHQDRPGQEKCADCAENFCGDCLVKLKGTSLCGPCKNFRLREVNKPSSVSGKAVVGILLAVCCAPLATCLVPFPISGFYRRPLRGGACWEQLLAMLLGGLALHDTEKDPRLTGRSLAITTLLTGGLAVVVTVFFMLLGPH